MFAAAKFHALFDIVHFFFDAYSQSQRYKAIQITAPVKPRMGLVRATMGTGHYGQGQPVSTLNRPHMGMPMVCTLLPVQTPAQSNSKLAIGAVQALTGHTAHAPAKPACTQAGGLSG